MMTELETHQASDIVVVLGGVVPPQDHKAMRAQGVAAIFGPGTQIPAAAKEILSLLAKHQR